MTAFAILAMFFREKDSGKFCIFGQIVFCILQTKLYFVKSFAFCGKLCVFGKFSYFEENLVFLDPGFERTKV